MTGAVSHEIPTAQPDSSVGNDSGLLDSGYSGLRTRYDSINGGFGNAPKFPSPHTISFLLRYAKRTGKNNALSMARKTLEAMAMGGIYDHLGSGFHRYSTDARWIVPHFEKMLYDQALLVTAYTEAYQATGDTWCREIAEDCLSYLTRDMASKEGGFFSARTQTAKGAREHTTSGLQEISTTCLGRMHRSSPGHITYRGRAISGSMVRTALRETMSCTGAFPLKNWPNRQECLRRNTGSTLRRCGRNYWRQGRPGPVRRKTIKFLPTGTAWRSLHSHSAAMAYDEESYLETARITADFLLRTMKKENGELLHRYRNGSARIKGLGSDYAYLTTGLLDLFEASQEPRYLEAALDIQAWFTGHFADGDKGGFFTSGDETTDLIVRKKDIYDGALPSVNSVTFLNLQKLGLFTADPGYHEQAWHLARSFMQAVEMSPEGYTGFLSALDVALGPSCEIVIAGRRGDPGTSEMRSAIRRNFFPSSVIIFRPSDDDATPIDTLTGFTASFIPREDRATAWVCNNHACGLPVYDVPSLLARLGEARGGAGD